MPYFQQRQHFILFYFIQKTTPNKINEDGR